MIRRWEWEQLNFKITTSILRIPPIVLSELLCISSWYNMAPHCSYSSVSKVGFINQLAEDESTGVQEKALRHGSFIFPCSWTNQNRHHRRMYFLNETHAATEKKINTTPLCLKKWNNILWKGTVCNGTSAGQAVLKRSNQRLQPLWSSYCPRQPAF